MEEITERVDPLKDNLSTSVRLGHLFRYNLAKRYCLNKDILDIGCGYGYGSWLLSKQARRVVGIDSSDEVIVEARKRYRNENLTFYVMDALDIDILGKFDLVTCFEVIEHLNNPLPLVDKIFFLLREGGRVIASTPNSKYTKSNPYHLQSFTTKEFCNLFLSRFEINNVQGQVLRIPILVGEGGKSLRQSYLSRCIDSVTVHLLTLLGWPLPDFSLHIIISARKTG